MKNKLIKSLCLITVAMSTTLLSACLPVLATGMVGGAMVVADRRPTSVITVDRGLQLEVESMLQKKYGANSHINVNVYNQKVLLTGEVPFKNILQEIEAQLKDFKNIKPPLINELKVETVSSTSTRISDSSLYALIKGKLVATTDVPSNSMKIVVENGRVYLLGIATELEAKAAGVVASKSSDSIKEVNKYFDIITEEEKRKIEGLSPAPATK